MNALYVLAPLLFIAVAGQFPDIFNNPWFNAKFSNNGTFNGNGIPSYWRPAGQFPHIFNNSWFNEKFPNNGTFNGNSIPSYWRPAYFRPSWWNNMTAQFRPRALPAYPYPTGSCVDQSRAQCNGSHSLFVGCLRYDNRLLFQQWYNKTGRFYSSRSKVIDYPGDYGFVRRNATITAISIQDKMCNGTGGYAQITKGGVGDIYTQIRLRSKGSGSGFAFFVQIFGM